MEPVVENIHAVSSSTENKSEDSSSLFDTKNKILLCITIILFFLVLFYLAYSLYVLLFVLKKNHSFVENVSAKTSEVRLLNNRDVIAPEPQHFRVIRVVDDKGMKLPLSVSDVSIVTLVSSVLEKDKRTPSYVIFDGNYTLGDIIISSSTALVTIGVPKGLDGETIFVVDLEKKEVSDIFSGDGEYFVDTNTFVIGNDKTGFSSYTYGASSSVKIDNSSLSLNESYIEWNDPKGSHGFKVLSTTKKSITFGVYDTTKGVITEGGLITHYPMIKEKTFLIP